MIDHYFSEGFPITPAIKEHVAHQLDDIHHHLPEGTRVSVNMHKIRKGLFRAGFRLHHRKHDFVCKSEDRDLYKAVTKAKGLLLKKVHEYKAKRVSINRKAFSKRRAQDLAC